MHTSLGRKVLRQMCGFLQVSKFSPDWSQFGPVLLSLFPLIWSGFYLNGFGDKLPGEIYILFGHKIQSECKLAFKIYWSKLLDDIKFVKMENYKSKFTFYQGNVQLTRLQRHTASKPKKIWWNCNKQTTTAKKKKYQRTLKGTGLQSLTWLQSDNLWLSKKKKKSIWVLFDPLCYV